MEVRKKTQSRRGLNSKSATDFRDDLNQFVKSLTRNNRYATFFYEEMWWNLKRLAYNRRNRFVRYRIDHRIPLKGEFKFLPLQFPGPGDPPPEFGYAWQIPWGRGGEYLSKLALEREAYYRQKKAWIIGKILHLSKRLFYFFDKISRKHKIPVIALEEIFNVITSHKEHLKDDPFFATFISKFIPIEERQRFLLDTSREVYDVLEEAFFVLMIIGMVESQRFRSPEIDGNFQKMREFLLDAACYPDMEKRIAEARSVNELEQYFQKEFSVFSSLRPRFFEFYQKSVEPLIEQGVLLRRRPMKVRIPGSSQTGIYGRVERVQEEGFQSIFRKGDSKDRESEWFEDTDEDTEPTIEDLRGEILDRIMSADRHRPDAAESAKWEREGFSNDVDMIFETKFLRGLVLTYKLRGSCFNLIGYLKAIFRNSVRTVTEKDYNTVLKSEKGISARTARRYKKALMEEKKLQRDDNCGQDEPLDQDTLSETQIDRMRERNLQKQKHHVQGFLTQNQIVNSLKGPGYSTTTLKRKIRKLRELKEIQCEKETGACRFIASEENLLKIAEGIKKL
jgi:hypothetical protein